MVILVLVNHIFDLHNQPSIHGLPKVLLVYEGGHPITGLTAVFGGATRRVCSLAPLIIVIYSLFFQRATSVSFDVFPLRQAKERLLNRTYPASFSHESFLTATLPLGHKQHRSLTKQQPASFPYLALSDVK
jgi:hypothetical protein